MPSGISVTIDSTGASAPDYATILSTLTTQFQSIFGSDAYLGADSQDGQFLAIFALAINDSNQNVIATYNSFSPQYAQGAALSSVIKINGLQRQVPTHSTAALTIVGQSGSLITNGIAQDELGNKWALPSSVTIPLGGSITETATCTTEGAIRAEQNTINKIATPTLGWQTVNNPAAATVGAPVETDAALRQRQSISTSISAVSVIDSLNSAIGNISGVQRYRLYENPEGGPDADGLPAHSISLVVDGGDLQIIANTIGEKKTPGTRTYGTTSEIYTDIRGVPNTINFYVLSTVAITCEIDITIKFGYVSTTATAIINAIVAYINSLDIGEDVEFSKLYTVANLDNGPLSSTYKLTAVKLSTGGSPTQADIVIPFNEAATCKAGDVSVITS